MKIIIIGAGICGLYIGLMLKNINIDFEIYEKSSRPGGKLKTIKFMDKSVECGANYIMPHHFNMINLCNQLGLKLTTVSNINIFSIDDKISYTKFNNILIKILQIYNKDKTKNISAIAYFQSILSNDEYELFKSYLFIEKLLNTEISDYMKYLFSDLKLIKNKKYLKVKKGMQLITDKMAHLVQEKLNLSHTVKAITYMPITNSYLLNINNILVQADKLIITTGSIQNIRLSISRLIKDQFVYIKPINIILLYTHHTKQITNIKYNELIHTQKQLTKISKISDTILGSNIVSDKSNSLFILLSDKNKNKNKNKNKKEIIEKLNKVMHNINNLSIAPIDNYIFCNWTSSAYYNTKKIKTNFWESHNLILAGEWVHPYHFTLEGSCMSALDTFKIISNSIYIDKLKHKTDNVKSIEENRL